MLNVVTLHMHITCSLGLVIAEIMRRFVWNFFRVEFAHVLAAEEDDQL